MPSMSPSDTSTGSRMSASSAHAFSSYGLIVGVSSVNASLTRIKPFMWLSAT